MATAFGMADLEVPSDGVVVGTGYVASRQVAAFSQEFMVMGGTLGKMHARKIVWARDYALKNGTPLIGFKDSGGARIQEGVDSLSGYGEVFYRNVVLSGVVPQIAIIAGPCAGGASYSPALMDFIIMTRQNAQMFITGPQVIKSVSGRSVSMDEVGGAEMHASLSGNVHLLADDDQHAIELTRRLLSYLPSNNADDPPHNLHARLRPGRWNGCPCALRPVRSDGHARHRAARVGQWRFVRNPRKLRQEPDRRFRPHRGPDRRRARQQLDGREKGRQGTGLWRHLRLSPQCQRLEDVSASQSPSAMPGAKRRDHLAALCPFSRYAIRVSPYFQCRCAVARAMPNRQ